MNLSSRRSLGGLKGRGEFEGPNCQTFKCLGGGGGGGDVEVSNS